MFLDHVWVPFICILFCVKTVNFSFSFFRNQVHIGHNVEEMGLFPCLIRADLKTLSHFSSLVVLVLHFLPQNTIRSTQSPRIPGTAWGDGMRLIADAFYEPCYGSFDLT